MRPIAGIDPDNTSVYILTDPAPRSPLVVDTDGDGNCDAINPLLAPTSGPSTQSRPGARRFGLAGVPPGGSADFRASRSIPALPITRPCVQGTDTAPPEVCCADFEQPTIAIGLLRTISRRSGRSSRSTRARCLGNQLDTRANNIPDGQWVCIAVGTADLAGNKSVSAPMRVYVKYNDDRRLLRHAARRSAGAPPTCTGTYDPASKTAALGSLQDPEVHRHRALLRPRRLLAHC